MNQAVFAPPALAMLFSVLIPGMSYSSNTIGEERVYEEARDRGIEVAPLGMYFIGRRTANGLLLGFASSRPDAVRRGVERLAAAIEAARD